MTRAAALSLTIFTGFTGLVYQVTWQKYLATLLGSHSEATAAVLGIFLGGLSVGYSLFGVVTSRMVARGDPNRAMTRRLLLAYGGIEALIGVYALAFPWLFRAAHSVSFVLPHANPGVGFVFDVILAALLIGPPAVLMGATIPILTQALSRSLDDATRFHAFVYGLNTLGAFVGALAAGFFVIPRLGLDGSLFAMGAINLIAGALYAALGLRDRTEAPTTSGAVEAEVGNLSTTWIYLTAALLIGFAMMTLETTLIRLAGLAFGSSQFTFSIVVAAFVLCIAIGGLAVSGLSRVPKVYLVINLWVLVALLTGLYFVLPQATYWVFVMRSAFSNLDVAFFLYHLAGIALLLLVIGLPVVLSGTTLPLIFHHLRDEYGELGSLAGRLYSWNTVGSLLGALIGGYALFFWYDLHHVYRFAVAALIVSAVLLTVRIFEMRVTVSAVIAPLLLSLALLPPWYSMMMQIGLFRAKEPPEGLFDGYRAFVERHVEPRAKSLLSYEDDPTATVSVLKLDHPGQGESRSIVVNGKSDGNTNVDYQTMALAGVLPALMADEIDRAFVIGWGTGVSVGELAALDGTKEVIAAEISSGVINAAPYFERYNLHAASQPSVTLLRSDAYRALTRSEANFNLILSEPSNPWVTGVEMLFSREFLELARDRLAEGGVYAQWYHKYETDDASLELVLRTFGSVFNHISVWEAGPNDLIILGFSDIGPAIDYLRLIERSHQPDFKAALARMGIENEAALLSKEFLPVGAWHAAKFEGPIHTLYRPRLSNIAGRAFFRRSLAQLPFTGYGEAAKIGAKNALLRRYMNFRGSGLTEEERASAVRQACRQSRGFGVTLVAAWINESPNSPVFKESYALATDWIRAKLPDEHDPEGLIEALSTLFEVNPAELRLTTPESAGKLTELYADFYYHAEPFNPAALTTAWSSCRERSMNRDQCMQRVPEGSEKLIQLMLKGGDAIEEYVRECMSRTYSGPLCQEGSRKAQELLTGTFSRSPD
ncbi:MAG: fused MFS/spermidine synthase [Deltaproteobacteria bacterium]|nr:fused MFS/spermidine synthase [Deltaproteobacteria bacterium]